MAEKALAALERRPVLRTRDLVAKGVTRATLSRLVEAGEIQRVGRGIYAHADYVPSEHPTLVEVQRQIPNGVICLLSALGFHQLTTQNPHQVWIGIDEDAWKPRFDYPPLQVVRFSEDAREFGVETHPIDGVKLRVTSPARTVADCFKYRNKTGLDVALEALRAFREQKAGSMDELWAAAEFDRVTRVIRPYLEAMNA
ncbi:MAG: type IV toxin-antitoxin system AbiEi family antitoxin domain-containing protein [Myxococcota bacterium]